LTACTGCMNWCKGWFLLVRIMSYRGSRGTTYPQFQYHCMHRIIIACIEWNQNWW
jgi:hypothetical protein